MQHLHVQTLVTKYSHMNTTTYVIAGVAGVVVAGGLIFASMTSAPDTAAITQKPVTNTNPTTMDTPTMETQKNIVETAVAAGDFNTLVAAVQAAGLVDTLSGPGPFTVFAPTDAAFAKLPAGTVEALLKDPAKLATILTYHVVPGKVMAKDVMGLSSAMTVQGSTIDIDTSNGVMVDNAKVTATDIETSNGVIHVIDTVLMP